MYRYLSGLRSSRDNPHVRQEILPFIVLYGVWSLGLILFRGEPFQDNRQIGYTLLITVFAFAGSGMVLVRDPLRAYVLGARVGTLLAVIAAVYLSATDGGRIGIGGNQAVFAFVAGVAAISAAIRCIGPHDTYRTAHIGWFWGLQRF